MEWNEFRSRVNYLSPDELDRVKKAYEMAQKAHEGQKRKSGDPYFTHPIAVATILAGMGADADTIIAALLHDTLEDSALKMNDIKKEFDGSVPELVDGVTKLTQKDLGENPTLEEETETLRKIFTSMQHDVRIMVIKLADRLHNMRTLYHMAKERQMSFAKETEEVFVIIADRLGMRAMRDELKALCLGILEPELFKRLSDLEKQNEEPGHAAIQSIHSSISKSFPQLTKNIKIYYEQKSWRKLSAQLEVEGAAATGISAFTAVFVCKNIPDCYRIFGALHEIWKHEDMSFNDFINTPMINGYRGLHTTIIMENGARVRCKIRTEEMDEYAGRGITAKCFDKKASGIFSYLPWTDKIAALSADTADRSAQFWNSLQSDILGDSITIYGPNDDAVSLPAGATALDGAVYLIGEKALFMTSLKINGKECAFSAPMENAATIDFSLTDKQTAGREWLNSVNTGYATALIRSALARQSDFMKIKTGKELLQKEIAEQKKGFIEELDQIGINEAINVIGYSSINEAYKAIADGHLNPEEAYNAIFEPKLILKGPRVSLSVIRYKRLMGDAELLSRIISMYTPFRNCFKSIHQEHKPEIKTEIITVKANLTNEQRKAFFLGLQAAGAQDIEITVVSPSFKYFLGAVILFWAINPVAAKWLLLRGIAPMSLLSIRLLGFAFFASVFYAIWKKFARGKHRPIKSAAKIAFMPAVAMVALPLFTYLALETMPPSVHLTILRFNILLLPMYSLARKHIVKKRSFLAILAICTATLAIMTLPQTELQTRGIILSVLALVSYTSYSLITEYTLQRHKIGIRYPQLIMNIGTMAGIVGLVMAPFQSWNGYSYWMIILILAYLFFCVFVPYVCFNAVLKNTQFKYVTDMFLLEIPIAILFESSILGIFLPPELYALTALIIALILFAHLKTGERTLHYL